MSVLSLALAVSTGLLGCAAPACPATIAEARSADFLDRLPPDALVGIGRVARFVASPDAEFRGYDVSVETRISGFEPEDAAMFVRVLDRIPGVEGGRRVIIIGARGQPPALIVPAGCPVLTPLESEPSDGA